jgi:hypothetical protein
MSSINEHNSALQQTRYFTTEDLEANRKGQYSQGQIQHEKNIREGTKQSVGKYQNKSWIISLVGSVGALFFCVILYFVGIFETFQSILGGLFFPVMAGLCIFAALFIFVIAPRSYQSSVDMYKTMGNSLEESPLGKIQVIEGRADIYESQMGVNRRGHRSSHKISYVLQIDKVTFNVTDMLMNTIKKNRLYRVYCVNHDDYWWELLSMETLE